MLEIMMNMARVVQPDDPQIEVDWRVDENARRAKIEVYYQNCDEQIIGSFTIDIDKIHGRVMIYQFDGQPDQSLFGPILARFRNLVVGGAVKLIMDLPEELMSVPSKQPLRLYVWHNVLSDHTAGVIFAQACSVYQARRVVIANALQNSDWAVKRIKEETAVEPEVYGEPAGFFVYGGG